MTNTTKPYRGLAMEGMIADWYTRSTLKDIKRHKMIAQQLAPKIVAGASVLEIAPGPGYFCVELAKLGDFRITGLDISKSFVEIARRNAAQAGAPIEYRLGNASDMPFADASFDFTFCQAAFKNFSQPVRAIEEMYRVLRPGGTALIADLRRDASPDDIAREVDNMGLGTLDRLFTKWTFKVMLLKTAYSVEQMESMIAQTPFKAGEIKTDGIGFQAWLHK